MSAQAIHQGFRLGVYPQREEHNEDALERIGSDYLARIQERLYSRRYPPHHVVRSVHAGAAELATLSDVALHAARDAISYQLKRKGLQPDLVLRCFAIVNEYAKRTLGMSYYDVQLYGAWVIINGNLAEMATGEGKSFTASLAAATAALANLPVHVITTNEYLAARDAKAMHQLYTALGLRSSTVLQAMDTASRQTAYASDIVYCTHQQVAFDYLRDRLTLQNRSGTVSLRFSAAYRQQQLMLRGLCFAIVDEADSVLIDEARTPLILSQEYGDAGQQAVYEQALALAEAMTPQEHYLHDPQLNTVTITAAGRAWLKTHTQTLKGIWTGTRHRHYLVQQALCAKHLFRRDRHYLVRDDKVNIIDRNTGRTMVDRSWQRGLQQMIECKEGCPLTGQRDTLASLSYQRFFRRYLKLGGMSGTLASVRSELRDVYQLRVIPIPTRKPCQRRDLGITLHTSATDKWLAILQRIETVHATGQPILVGTDSLKDSELLSTFLRRRGLLVQVLNARQDMKEARIVAEAGQRGQITVATNMAGRGTDIALGEGVAALGGLHVINAQCHPESRVDRQLIGRCARQGDPGTSEHHIALDEELFVNFYPATLLTTLKQRLIDEKPLSDTLLRHFLKLPQLAASREQRLQRRDIAQMQEKLGPLMAYAGPQD